MCCHRSAGTHGDFKWQNAVVEQPAADSFQGQPRNAANQEEMCRLYSHWIFTLTFILFLGLWQKYQVMIRNKTPFPLLKALMLSPSALSLRWNKSQKPYLEKKKRLPWVTNLYWNLQEINSEAHTLKQNCTHVYRVHSNGSALLSPVDNGSSSPKKELPSVVTRENIMIN